MPAPQHPDNDPTDELPVLSDVALAEYESQASQSVDDTGERTLEIPGPARRALGGDSEPAPFASLERDVAELTTRWRRLESQFAESAGAVAALTEQLTTAQRTLGESTAGRQHLSQELEEKERQLASLSDQYRQLQRDNAALREAVDRFAAEKESLSSRLAAASEDSSARAELEAQLEQRQALERELQQAQRRIGELERSGAAAREEAQARTAELQVELTAAEQLIEQLAPAEEAKGADVEAYRAEIATLSDYITNRRRYWDDMEARLAAQHERIAELETEVEHRRERQQAAERTAQREAALAAELKERLSSTALELEAAQDDAAARQEASGADAAGGEERIRQLERQLRAAREELKAREGALSEAQGEARESRRRLAALGEELAAARANGENARGRLQALEAQLAERDQGTALHKERLARLQRELDTNLDGLRSLEQEQLVEAERSAAANGTDMHAMLVCLTSEQPQEYALAKPVMTIGRGGECDIQILTHFVSREHARLLVGPDDIAIEDLGSTNGVFVNSVRVERQALHHGDWITIGETQFRFLSGERA